MTSNPFIENRLELQERIILTFLWNLNPDYQISELLGNNTLQAEAVASQTIQALYDRSCECGESRDMQRNQLNVINK